MAWISIFGVIIAMYVAGMASGQSMSSDGCYQVYPNSKVNCMSAYKTQVVASEQQCRDLCTQGAPQCQSAQFTTASAQCDLFNTFIPVGAAGRRKRLVPIRAKRGSYAGTGSYRPSYAGGGGGGGAYPAPAPSYRPAGPSYPAPAPSYNKPQTYPAPAPSYRPAPAPSYGAAKPSYGGGGGGGCGGYGPSVQPIGGYTYCKPTGTCLGTQTTPPPVVTTPAPACPAGQVLRYYKATGYRLQATADFTFNTDTEQACVTACTNNQQPTGTAAMCKSADYNTQTKQCLIFTSAALPPTGSAGAAPDSGSTHYEKVCVDATLGRCQGPFFVGPQMILIGFAQSVTTATSMSDCLNLCANSQSRFGFNCLSGMFYFQETSNNCILNSESRATHPDLYNQENQDKVNYFEPGCASARFLRAALRETRNRNVLRLDTPDFGPWTLCDRMVLGHKRFKACSTLNPNKCTRDENICDPKKEDEYDLQIVQPVKSGNNQTTTAAAPSTTPGPSKGEKSEEVTKVTKTISKETVLTQVQARDSGHSQHSGGGPPVLPAGRCFPLVNLDGTKDCEHGTMFSTSGKRMDCVPTFLECAS